MLPKLIHYCWFGKNPLPPLALQCIESWKKFFPDYEIIEWNEDNFDVNMVSYTREAYQEKKYAFVSDYARFWILHKYGGLYFDTDVEIIKPMDKIVNLGAFMGVENESSLENRIFVAPGLGMGSYKGDSILKELLDYYSILHFINVDGSYNLKTVVEYTTEILHEHDLKNSCKIQKCGNFYIYPKEYFNPMTPSGIINIKQNTYSIHHYAGTWIPFSMKFKKAIIKFCGNKIWCHIQKLRGKIK